MKQSTKKIIVQKISKCWDCPHKNHTGGFTNGGAFIRDGGVKSKSPKIIIEIDQPDDFIPPCEICGGMESCANGYPNE